MAKDTTGRLHVTVKSGGKRKLSSKLWLERQLNDPYVAQAKRDGYRSRAAYKLIEIDDKYHFLKPGIAVVDLGAAPGGWSQIAAKRVGAVNGKGKVVAIDLLEMPEIPGVNFAQLDFLAEDAPEKLIAMMGGRADVVMSDMARQHHRPPQDRSAAHRRPGRNGGGVCRRRAQSRRHVPGQGLSERRRRRTGRAVEARFCQRAPRQAGLEPAGFVGALCAGDGVSRAAQSGVSAALRIRVVASVKTGLPARWPSKSLKLLEFFPETGILVVRRGLFNCMQSDAPCRSEPRLRLGRSIPAMEQRTTVGNRLLAALPPADIDLLVPHFRKVALERDTVLVRSGDPVQRIYFPLSGLVAFIMDMPSGETVATAVVGNDGAAGLLSALGPTRSPVTTAVRIAGTALQISPARFKRRSGAATP